MNGYISLKILSNITIVKISIRHISFEAFTSKLNEIFRGWQSHLVVQVNQYFGDPLFLQYPVIIPVMGRKAVTQNKWRGYHPEGVYGTEFCFQMTYILFRLTQPFLTALWARHKWDVLFHLDTLSVKYTELKCTKRKE